MNIRFSLLAIKAREAVMFLSHRTYSFLKSSVCAALWAAGLCVSLENVLAVLCFIFSVRFHFLFHKRISRLALGAFGNIFEDTPVLFHPGRGANEGPSRHESTQVRV